MPFHVKRVETLDALWKLFLEFPDAYPVAGGTDILPRVNQGIEAHEMFVCLENIKDLRGITYLDDGSVKIGALTKLAEIAEEKLLSEFTALNQACSKAASPQIRNQATIGGNVLQENRCIYFNQSVSWRRADPCFKLGGDRCYQYKGSPKCVALFQSDVAPVLMSYGADAVFVSPRGTRSVPLRSIYMEAGRKDKKKDEILSELVIPAKKGRFRSAYARETIRGSFDFPLVSCALSFTEIDHIIEEAAMVMGSAGVMPRFVAEASDLLHGLEVNKIALKLDELKKHAARAVFPFRDSRVDTISRKAFAQSLVEKVIKILQA
ncbi:FAD binding domain-containing protein [Cloacibacillus evryensis]|uniref:FAD binding domain-containing protein n=1 Tax=Cloacibacillus evryensis TaxID=508460 RepID=UPI0022E1E9E7|nr:FAD binding domain-containing protein [Cloacibacillus evryensis]MEA5035115.1 FAD binding domain-containing protein [Cloacibacillus evryensis]